MMRDVRSVMSYLTLNIANPILMNKNLKSLETSY